MVIDIVRKLLRRAIDSGIYAKIISGVGVKKLLPQKFRTRELKIGRMKIGSFDSRLVLAQHP